MRRSRLWLIGAWSVVLAVEGLAGTLPAPELVARITPEVTHKQYRLTNPRAVVNVLEVCLRGAVELAAVKAGERISSCAPLSELLRTAGPGVVAGINGDFFSETGSPIGPHLHDGQVVKNGPRRPVIGETVSGEIFVTVGQLQAHVRCADGQALQVSGFNRGRGTDELIVFNRWFGGSTRTNRWGTEVTLAGMGSGLAANPLLTLVTRVDTMGNSAIPAQDMVLSGYGRAAEALRTCCSVGDTVRLGLQVPPVKGAVKWLVGGGPLLVHEGQVAGEHLASWGNGGFAWSRHPRTAVGVSADGTTAFLVAVDGRQPGYSEGMTLSELATFLTQLGAHQAINLDGGGSTTMVIAGKAVNRPAEDGQERPVSNAVVVRRKAMEGP